MLLAERSGRVPPTPPHPFSVESFKTNPQATSQITTKRGFPPCSPPTASAATVITQPVIKVICTQQDPELHMPSRIFQPVAILQSRAKCFIGKIPPRHSIPRRLAQDPGAGTAAGESAIQPDLSINLNLGDAELL